ncbi:YcaO-like family protein [Streptomyces tubercidicus]
MGGGRCRLLGGKAKEEGEDRAEEVEEREDPDDADDAEWADGQADDGRADVVARVTSLTGCSPLAVDHTRPNLGVPAVQVVCPGLDLAQQI